MELHRSMVGSRSNDDLRDFYETPSEAIHRLFKVWKPPFKKIWEPCCGTRSISKVLKIYNYDLISSDIEDRGYGHTGVDFLQKTETEAPMIFTNPPYNISTEFVNHSLKLAEQSVFLLRLQWLEGERRRKQLFSSNKLANVFVFSKRIPRMHVPGYDGKKVTSTIAFAWFHFDNNHNSHPNIQWIP